MKIHTRAVDAPARLREASTAPRRHNHPKLPLGRGSSGPDVGFDRAPQGYLLLPVLGVMLAISAILGVIIWVMDLLPEDAK